MEIIGKVSKGSKMDQIYIPKNRGGFPIGDYVIITALSKELEAQDKKKPYFYNVKFIEPLKLRIIEEIFRILDKNVKNYENIIITGSFLEKGFYFNDIDILFISDEKSKIEKFEQMIENQTGIKPHIILVNNKSLIQGLSTDPLYQSMLSRCVSKKRLIYKVNSKINYKLLDLQLLKSKIIFENFDILSGSEKYYYLQNMIAILLFLKSQKITKDEINKNIEQLFGLSVDKIKFNLLDKKVFLKKYREIYNKIFNKIIRNIKNATK